MKETVVFTASIKETYPVPYIDGTEPPQLGLKLQVQGVGEKDESFFWTGTEEGEKLREALFLILGIKSDEELKGQMIRVQYDAEDTYILRLIGHADNGLWCDPIEITGLTPAVDMMPEGMKVAWRQRMKDLESGNGHS